MATLNQKITALEATVKSLQAALEKITAIATDKPKSFTAGGASDDISEIASLDITTGQGSFRGGAIIWNSKELSRPPANAEITIPTVADKDVGYHKHTHSRFSGGALIKNGLEIVEYEDNAFTNVHSQGYWQGKKLYKTESNSNGVQVAKIGLLDLVFNPDKGTWGVASYEIDVTKCYLVERVTVIDNDNPVIGEIKKDSKGQEMKSYLYNSDTNKSSVVWDENGACWRLYAVYAPGETTP